MRTRRISGDSRNEPPVLLVFRVVIVGIYGEKWRETVVFLQISCAVTVLYCIQHQLQSALIAVGRANRLAKALSFGAVAQWLGIVAGYRAAGVQGLLYGILLTRSLEFLLVTWQCLQETKSTVREFTQAVLPPAVLSMAMGLAVWAIRRTCLGRMPLLLDLTVASGAGALVYTLSVLCFRPEAVRDMAGFVHSRLGDRWPFLASVVRFLRSAKE